jgi:hypothetical protein
VKGILAVETSVTAFDMIPAEGRQRLLKKPDLYPASIGSISIASSWRPVQGDGFLDCQIRLFARPFSSYRVLALLATLLSLQKVQCASKISRILVRILAIGTFFLLPAMLDCKP